MTTGPTPAPSPSPRSTSQASWLSSRLSAAKEHVEGTVGLLDRPLTSYYLLVGTTALLTGLGLLMVLSASSVTSYASTGSSFTLFEKQAMWVGAGIPLMWLAARLPARIYRVCAYPLLLLAIGGLALVLVPGVGETVNGATRWVDVGPFQIQPSEPAKLGLILWGADLLARKQRLGLLREWRHLLVPLMPGTGFVVLLVMMGDDLGTTLILLTVFLALLWVVGAPARLFTGMFGFVVLVVCILVVVEPYRLKRLTTFLDPFAHLYGSGWQSVQGIYALASGGFWGVGLGASREKWDYLPHAQTDFIFAIIGEELGLMGTLVVLALFGLLGYAGIRVARRNKDPFIRLAATGATAWLVVQALVNIGAVIGVLPITGIPLPLVSYGGSALLPTLIAIGMLLSFAKREPGAGRALAARGPGAAVRAMGWLGFRSRGR
ncbi:MAG: putative lipid II flippase FtsW [Streptosporangiaceae bacterium]